MGIRDEYDTDCEECGSFNCKKYYCDECLKKLAEQGKAQALKQVLEIIDKELNNCDKYIPKEDNHNFNRNTMIGITKNTLLILKAELEKP